MDTKTKLQISINEANSLKQITKMSGWNNIIEPHIKKSEIECLATLKDVTNKDMVDIQGARFLLDWIKQFKDMFRFKEISASFDERELKRLK